MKSLLLLDDDADLRDVLALYLEGVHHLRLVSAASLDEVVQQDSEALSTDVALIDINLGPGKPTGIDAYKWLRENSYPGNIVFFTGHAHNHPLLREASKIPGVTVLEKPIKIAELEQLLSDGGPAWENHSPTP